MLVKSAGQHCEEVLVGPSLIFFNEPKLASRDVPNTKVIFPFTYIQVITSLLVLKLIRFLSIREQETVHWPIGDESWATAIDPRLQFSITDTTKYSQPA